MHSVYVSPAIRFSIVHTRITRDYFFLSKFFPSSRPLHGVAKGSTTTSGGGGGGHRAPMHTATPITLVLCVLIKKKKKTRTEILFLFFFFSLASHDSYTHVDVGDFLHALKQIISSDGFFFIFYKPSCILYSFDFLFYSHAHASAFLSVAATLCACLFLRVIFIIIIIIVMLSSPSSSVIKLIQYGCNSIPLSINNYNTENRICINAFF